MAAEDKQQQCKLSWLNSELCYPANLSECRRAAYLPTWRTTSLNIRGCMMPMMPLCQIPDIVESCS